MKVPHHMLRLLAALVLLAGINATAWADQFEDAGDAYQSGNYDRAFGLLKPLAEDGNVDAQAIVGLMYALGQGVIQDPDEAVKWYRLAAEQGHADAQFNLAVIYYLSAGVDPDDKEASHWYGLAADQGVAAAQYNLGYMFYKGHGVTRDYVQAYKWWSLAAAQDHEHAARNRDVAASKMTPSQLEEAQRLVEEWLAAHPQ
ncbi:MAG: tetratricopeptide repeat protein [Dongiaceae bacterium]